MNQITLNPGKSSANDQNVMIRIWKLLKMTPLSFLRIAFILSPTIGFAEVGQTCIASNAQQFQTCAETADGSGNSYSRIKVTAPINCDDSANSCRFTLSNINRNFVVEGVGEEAGFHRSGEHGGYMHNTLTISASSGPILVKNMVFDEGKNQPLPYDYVASHDPAVDLWTNQISSLCHAQPPPPGKTYVNPCAGNSLRITSSSNVTVDNVQFIDAKNFGIQIDTSSSNITIKDSIFLGAWFNAIWSQNNGTIHGLHIMNNTFRNNRSNALEISAATPQPPDTLQYNTIIGNVFENNHNTGLFYQSGCHGTGNVCGGGQLLILSKSSDFQVQGNEIRNGGGSDTYITRQNNDVRGIEIDNVGVSNLIVTQNNIHNNSGPAIDIAYNTKMAPLAHDIRVYSNKLADNDSMHFGSPFNNEWFLNSEQNIKNDGVVPKDGCEYVPSPLAASHGCKVLLKVKPYDWDNGAP